MKLQFEYEVVFFDIGNTLIAKKEWIEGAKETIDALRQRGVRLGIISNTGNLSREALGKRLPEDFDLGLFEESLVLLSSETGVEKPKIDAFLLAVQHAGCSPWRTLFIGESWTETLAAQRAGMHTIRVCDAKKDYQQFKKLLN